MTFGLETLEGSDQMSDYLSLCDVSESNNAKWNNNISTKYVDPKWGTCRTWTRSMTVVHVDI